MLSILLSTVVLVLFLSSGRALKKAGSQLKLLFLKKKKLLLLEVEAVYSVARLFSRSSLHCPWLLTVAYPS